MSLVYNSQLAHLPQRTIKSRTNGVTMVMDKGISTRQAEDMISTSSDYIDFVKLGFGTSIISKNTKEKIKLYKEAGIKVYVGGTLFEAFVIRNKFEDFKENAVLASCILAAIAQPFGLAPVFIKP